MHHHLTTHHLTYNAVGMGLGKTATTLLAIADAILDFRSIGALVVAPLRVATMTWPWEVRKWDETAWLKVADLRTPEGQEAFLDASAHIYTINYESLHKLTALAKQRGSLPYDIEVWDEITMAKSHSSKRINRFRKETRRAPRRWGLTGTPTPNSLLDLFAQIRLLDNGERLGRAITRFRSAFFEPDFMGYTYTIRPGAADIIHSKIADIALALRSEDWLDIPDVHIEDVAVPLGDHQKAYDELKKELILEIDDEVVTAANAAVLVSKLLQFTSGVLYGEDGATASVHDAKLKALRKLVTDDPLLVMVAYRHEMDRIREEFPEAQFVEDHGPELFERWNRGEVPMLVAHPRSVGHGLNLQAGGNRMVWFTLTYSRECYEQGIARLARRGQLAETTVYRLICPGTIDEVVVEVLRDKKQGENRLLDALKMLKEKR